MSRPALLLVLLVLLVPAQAKGHAGGEPLVIVPVDHVLPGESFPLAGADLGQDAVVSFELRQEDVVAPLGRVTADVYGHFESSFVMPATFPEGYTQLVASSSDGSEASTWVLVGERTEATPAPPSGREWGRKTTAIVLALVVGVTGAALALVAMGSRRRTGDEPQE